MDNPVETWTVRFDADMSELEGGLAKAQSSGQQFGRVLTNAFQGVALQGKGLTETLRSVGMSLSQLALKAAFKPFEQAAGGLLQGLIGGTLGGGGAAGGGMVKPFAAGGVISSPIAFPLSGGATGIAGERGAEAIMPLARGPDGRLGVKSNGRAGNVSVTFNVTTPDVESFRQTQAQISSMLARAVAQGQRHL